MKRKLIYIFCISLLCCSGIWAQGSSVVKNKDTLRQNNSYGLRVGVDLQNIVTSFTNPNFKGVEFMADYRLTDKYYLAGELGNQKKTSNETSISTTADGSYIKVGLDCNVYKNLVGLRNMIFIGARYGFATYSQELNSYNIATQNNFFGVDSGDQNLQSEGLTAHWLEMLVGIKAEIFNNLYVGFSVSVQRKLSDESPNGFESLYIPGYGTTNDFGEVSAGYRYFVSYFIPLYKRNKKIKKDKDASAEEIKEKK